MNSTTAYYLYKYLAYINKMKTIDNVTLLLSVKHGERQPKPVKDQYACRKVDNALHVLLTLLKMFYIFYRSGDDQLSLEAF